jgi:hypothetical protein
LLCDDCDYAVLIPDYQLTKADESLLFEFEVQFRGACDEPTLLACMHTLLTELLEDFPAEVFLTRPTVSSATLLYHHFVFLFYIVMMLYAITACGYQYRPMHQHLVAALGVLCASQCCALA